MEAWDNGGCRCCGGGGGDLFPPRIRDADLGLVAGVEILTDLEVLIVLESGILCDYVVFCESDSDDKDVVR